VAEGFGKSALAFLSFLPSGTKTAFLTNGHLAVGGQTKTGLIGLGGPPTIFWERLGGKPNSLGICAKLFQGSTFGGLWVVRGPLRKGKRIGESP